LLDPIRAQLFPNDFTVTFPTVSITMGFQSYIRPFPNSISSVFSAYSLFQHFNVRPIREDLITMAGVFYTNQNRKEGRKLGMGEIMFRIRWALPHAIRSIPTALKFVS